MLIPSLSPQAALLEGLVQIALQAGEKALEIYHGDFTVMTKEDDSPVTRADREAEAIILEGLKKLQPGVAVIAEEQYAATKKGYNTDSFFLVDPIDGTKEFINKRDEFTVNIALIKKGMPILGVIYAPATGQIYGGDVLAKSAWTAKVEPNQEFLNHTAITTRQPSEKLDVMTSFSHNNPATEAYLDSLPVGERIKAGSSLKFCWLAEGKADIYPRLSPTHEWDTAAGHAILLAAGGNVVTVDGEALLYGKPGYLNPGFIAYGAEQPLLPPQS
ncbi:MAG: 3'(2'),5'-bisphosphate nucleotidase CysQ [Zymomonas mobilis subsp. pomaceae]|uniref:3'(2'),5'-bisphosphate nucleotidase CysQ n=1 Tax=Zymomonas mobilis subsp. pomaceae (strain ATCC 29192 / DSM 22645 / JCM 10191 / CCUG 17912 / NBRC 13757 / NCIMB 11200 / NRRL B-4491 / Barker I) TaxID=579138 RepID=F8EVT3_ZYMMT|nr:3'(2'),5'-bisphosphate nucleotidase CysQ [Zymomonas mobilis]AEI37410.1 3'(2'),5'-bisphosphate nucleotidase [Zymomonas mobilis subsp. pomaceae ATCC 29192]MDX5948778.1 3'(2'),5'-bisphosphate nucleotidase CysQ [Zymomonas mobilis subsp. pomaceae]GEB88585.1 3'(2'),5'-bisphosphate nucleotidase CysQ [Zymomonas mobilis subsp. pomaceae]